jgi:hypothetical protein
MAALMDKSVAVKLLNEKEVECNERMCRNDGAD